jgi:hypothetical protein
VLKQKATGAYVVVKGMNSVAYVTKVVVPKATLQKGEKVMVPLGYIGDAYDVVDASAEQLASMDVMSTYKPMGADALQHLSDTQEPSTVGGKMPGKADTLLPMKAGDDDYTNMFLDKHSGLNEQIVKMKSLTKKLL